VKIVCTVNGQRRELDVRPMRRLLDVLREDLGLTGTKEGCGEGECGACAVHVDGRLMNACQMPVFQAHGRGIVTIEGLGDRDHPDPLQAAFVETGGVQCGFCTPGLLMASRALLNASPQPTETEIREGLAGNLCRCTGYGRVIEAVQLAAGVPVVDAPAPVDGSGLPVPAPDDAVHVLIPDRLDQALADRAAGPCTILAGGTDLMAAFNAGLPVPDRVLDVSCLQELRGIEVTAAGVRIGSATSYSDLIDSPDVTRIWPAMAEAARLVGAPAVQNMGTVGGNLANASPGADLVPALAALAGVVVLVSRQGERRVPVTEFYRGYRDCDCRPDELIAAVDLPTPAPDLRQAFFKAGTRRAQSIARVNLAACARIDGQGSLRDVRLVAGSVAPTIALLPRTTAWLEGRAISAPNLADEAAALAADEITPIDDVRASAAYRRTVLGNLVARFLRG